MSADGVADFERLLSIVRTAENAASRDGYAAGLAEAVAILVSTNHYFPAQDLLKRLRANGTVVKRAALVERLAGAVEAMRHMVPDADEATCADAEDGEPCGNCNECAARDALRALGEVQR